MYFFYIKINIFTKLQLFTLILLVVIIFFIVGIYCICIIHVLSGNLYIRPRVIFCKLIMPYFTVGMRVTVGVALVLVTYCVLARKWRNGRYHISCMAYPLLHAFIIYYHVPQIFQFFIKFVFFKCSFFSLFLQKSYFGFYEIYIAYPY